MNTTATRLTTATLDAMYADEEWLGYGYLDVAAADAMVLDYANANDWTERDLFAWANSKDGRWFADCVLGSGITDQHAPQYLRKQR